MSNKIAEELPSTDQGLVLYINYCENQITRNKNHTVCLRRRMDKAGKKLRVIRGEK